MSDTGMKICTGSSGYRYLCRTESSNVSGKGADAVPDYSKSPVPVIPAVYTGCMPRYVPYREHPSHFFGFEVISIWVKTLFGLFLTEVGSVTA